ncbi:MAG: hypothetical protein PUJ57_05855 [Peptoniphilaceae bacterium]|nr:hypothetical protein [Peptoniphilaceae bacterium]MDY6085788.1 hypothetical protein [Peptoniphilaceae bacterium]
MAALQPFSGTPSVLFDDLEKGDFDSLKHLEILEDYGAYGTAETGEPIPLFQWQDGGRKLARHEADGALFLIQTSVVFGEEEPEEERDWYQVNSAAHAEWLNAHADGPTLAYHYRGPKIWSASGAIHYEK